MNCINCGTSNSDDALHCQRCGNRLNATDQSIPTILSETLPSPPSQYQIVPTEKAELSSSPYTAYGSTPPPPPYSSYMANPYELPLQPKGGKRLWIILGIGGVVILLLVVAAGYIYFNQSPQSTPSKTLQAACDATKSRDYQAQYNLFSSSFQSQIGTEGQYASRSQQANAGKGSIVNCSVSNLVVNGSSASVVAINTYGDGSMITYDIQLVDENGVWKISNVTQRT